MAVASPSLPTVGDTPIVRGYRRSLVMAGVAAVACFAALVATGHPLVGGLVAAGLGAGAWNAWRVQQSAPKVLAGGIVHKGALGGSGVRRLGYVTLLVLACTLAFRPVGWTVALGLAGFQVLLVVNTVAPLVREVRRG